VLATLGYPPRHKICG